MKRTLTIVLALLLLAAIPSPVFGQEEVLLSSGDHQYRILEDGTAEIAKYSGQAASLEVPISLDGLTVTNIGYKAFENCESLTEITVPDSVTNIGEFAFAGCKSLTSITIPDSVTSIGGAAFFGCESLKEITIPDSVTNIGISAFFNCGSLKEITIPNSITNVGDNPFAMCGNLNQVLVSWDHPT